MSRHHNLLNRDRSALVVVDVQEKFRNHIDGFDAIVANIVRLLEACKIMSIPFFITEQYPKGLGVTISELSRVFEIKADREQCSAPENSKILPTQFDCSNVVFEKTAFSCCGSSEFQRALRESGRTQVMVCGIEAHVCVNQTVHDLIADNYQVHIVEDAISSRLAFNKELAFRKMASSGAVATCTEMALLELVQDSASPEFRAVQALIK